jgi:hypothetical protein
MGHEYYHVVFFNPTRQDNYGMPDPFNSYIFFLGIQQNLGLTEIEIYAADDKTKVPRAIQATAIKKTNLKEVAEDVFDILAALPENKGLKHRRFF